MKQLWWRLVQFGFRLLYYEMAWTYDVVSWFVSAGQWRTWQRAALAFVPNGRVLELAHGPGHMLLALAERGDKPAGIDLSPHMSLLAKRRLAHIRPQIPLARCAVQALPFPDQSFDAVLSTFPTNYIVDPATIANAYRVLKPEGKFVILPEGHLTGGGLFAKFITLLFILTGQRPNSDDALWERLFRGSTLWQQLTHHGERVGFQFELHIPTFKRSACTVIVATRRSAPLD